jgi:hypothetical protein
MTKATKTAIANAIPSAESNVSALPEITSFKNAGYQSALIKERGDIIARFVIDNCPTFLEPKGIPDEIRNELKEGLALRFQENHPAVSYTADWIPAVDGKNAMHIATLAYAMSYSQQAFGAIDDPIKKGILKQIRDDFSTYVSNTIGNIKTAIRKLDKTAKPKTPPAEFMDYMNNREKGIWVTVKARRKTAEQRGDTTTPSELALRMAIDAFNEALTKNSK